jgi:16S rRNA (uracil1498-N3)-methyltransferase
LSGRSAAPPPHLVQSWVEPDVPGGYSRARGFPGSLYAARVNLLLLEPDELAAGTNAAPVDIELAPEDRRAQHLRGVLRARPGQIVRAGAIRGATGRAEVLAADEDGVRLRVSLDGPRSLRPPVDLVLAMPRPKVLPRVLEIAASFGVGRIDLVNAWRVDRSYLASPRLDRDALGAALRRGCEQGATTWVPDIDLHPLLMRFLDQAPARWPAGSNRVIAHPRAGSPIESAVRPRAESPTVVAIGPEGGWIDRELDSFAALGFAAVSLGPAVLRVEAAVAAVLAQIQLLRRLDAPG